MKTLTVLMLSAALGGIAQAASLSGNYGFTGQDVCNWQGPNGPANSVATVTGTATFSGTTASLTESVNGNLTMIFGGNTNLGFFMGSQSFSMAIAASGSGYTGTETNGSDVGSYLAGPQGGLTFLATGQAPWQIVPSGSSGRNQDILLSQGGGSSPTFENWAFSDTSQWSVVCFRTRSLTKVTGDDTN